MTRFKTRLGEEDERKRECVGETLNVVFLYVVLATTVLNVAVLKPVDQYIILFVKPSKSVYNG